MPFHQLRWILIILFPLLGGMLFIWAEGKGSVYLFAASLLLLLTHFLFGTVWQAFASLKRGDLEQADRLIRNVRHPKLLTKRHRAYYHFIRGMIYLQYKQLEHGKQHLQQALDLGLQSPTDKALVALNLAHVSYVEKDYDKSRAYLEQARQQDTTDLMIQENIKKLEAAMAK
jgi:Flp pilus assembly protein TadD